MRIRIGLPQLGGCRVGGAGQKKFTVAPVPRSSGGHDVGHRIIEVPVVAPETFATR
jgi:hypothetical protein